MSKSSRIIYQHNIILLSVQSNRSSVLGCLPLTMSLPKYKCHVECLLLTDWITFSYLMTNTVLK